MTDQLSIGLTKLLRKTQIAEDVDFLREGMRVFSEAVMELEVTQHVGAPRHARTPERTGQRNGYRERRWDTRVGTIDLQVPRVRDGSYFPALLDPRRQTERALVAVVQEAYVHGVSTRRVDDLVQALDVTGISTSEVSQLCATLDAEVERFRMRPLTGQYPYLWLDATYLNVRQDGRVVSMTVVIAIGVNAEGRREVLGLDVGPSEEEAGALWAAWQQFLRGLVERGLIGVQLVISDAHAGLKRALVTILHGTSWQRCRVHTMRTQSRHRRTRTVRVRRRAVQWDDIMDLERPFPHDDLLDQQLHQRLLLAERRRRQAAVVVDALDMAIARRRPEAGVIHHSDHGSQYTSLTFGQRLHDAGIVASQGSRGDCYDNALMESFFATLECELLDGRAFPTHSAGTQALFNYLEGFYNTERRHSALDYLFTNSIRKEMDNARSGRLIWNCPRKRLFRDLRDG